MGTKEIQDILLLTRKIDTNDWFRRADQNIVFEVLNLEKKSLIGCMLEISLFCHHHFTRSFYIHQKQYIKIKLHLRARHSIHNADVWGHATLKPRKCIKIVQQSRFFISLRWTSSFLDREPPWPTDYTRRGRLLGRCHRPWEP